jgi:antitoxin FitA
MPSVQIKNVPEDVHRELRRRAGTAGQSLQEYLLARLIEVAREEPLEDVLSRAGNRAGGSLPFSLARRAVRSDREQR